MKETNPSDQGLSISQPFFGHAEELKVRLLRSLLAIIICASLVATQMDQIINFMVQPVGHVVFTAPSDAFMVRLSLILFGGALVSSPYILMEIWQFVALGLKKSERKYISMFAPFSALLFMAGSLFAFFLAIPISLQFLLSFSSEAMVPMITIKSYTSFVMTMMLAFGVVFELPLVMLFLTKIGIATPAFLTQKRKHAIIIILILSALITPPDFITQIIMSGPLILLYEVGVIASKWAYRSNDFDHPSS